MEGQNQDNIYTCEQPTRKSVQKHSRILGTLGGILGISSMFVGFAVLSLSFLEIGGFSTFDYTYYIGYPLSILGLIFSILSIVRKERVLGLAIPGIVCSVFGFFETPEDAVWDMQNTKKETKIW
ncbi:MAG: hypothetical protein K2K19_06525 [Acetatifactor sp.]|nr:hypothetical protein [Acetatifactor sp.]